MIPRSLMLLIMVLVCGVVACGGADSLPDNERLLDAFEQGRTGVWVSGHGTVAQLIGDETIGGDPHQRLVIEIEGQLDLMIRHSLSESQRVPAQENDILAFRGRYHFDGRGGVLSLTHQDPDQPGGGGWIRRGETLYD